MECLPQLYEVGVTTSSTGGKAVVQKLELNAETLVNGEPRLEPRSVVPSPVFRRAVLQGLKLAGTSTATGVPALLQLLPPFGLDGAPNPKRRTQSQFCCMQIWKAITEFRVFQVCSTPRKLMLEINIEGENCPIFHHPSFSTVFCDLSTYLLQSINFDFLLHRDKHSP